MNLPAKTVPVRTRLTAPFWDAGLRGELLLQYDPETRRHQFYPRPVSLFSKASPEWRRASGRGEVIAATQQFASGPGFEPDAPYTMVLVTLAEGPRILAELRGIDFAAVKPGLPVRMAWETRAPGTAVYHFVPEEHA